MIGNEYTATYLFSFAEEIYKQDPNFHVVSLDIDSLFTNISLNETIDNGIDSLYSDNENTPLRPPLFNTLFNVMSTRFKN